MIKIELTEKEVDLLKKSVQHCLETCKNKDSKNCTDCAQMETILNKLNESN